MGAFCGIVRKFAAKLFKQDRMNKIYRTLCALVVGAMAFASCLSSDDEETIVSNDTAIVQFTLGTLNRYTHTTSSTTGNDTVVKTTVSGSTYKMTIDHQQRRIYNTKELPVGTDISHVICTISTKNSGVIAIQSMTSDSLRWFSSSDSIDFSSPRIFRVIATSGMTYRDYTVELNVSPTTGVDFGWQLEKTDETLAGWSDKKLIALADTVLMVDKGVIAVNNIYEGEPAVMRIGTNGYVEMAQYNSEGGLGSWENYQYDAAKPGLKQLLGATAHEIYALGEDGRLKVSTEGLGPNWNDEQLDDNVELLPSEGTTVNWAYDPAGSADYVLLVGKPRQDDKYMRVWRKISYHEGAGQWVYMPFDDANHYSLENTERFTMVYYDKSVLCVGSDLVMRQSRDEGITWRETSTYALPTALTGSTVIMAVDSSQRLWLLTDTGQLWQGGLK